MGKYRVSLVLTIAGAMCAAAGEAAAQQAPSTQSQTNAAGAKPAEASDSAIAVQRAQLAADLAAYGRETRNAMALLVAGQIQAEVAATEEARTKTTEGRPAPPDTAKSGEATRTSAAALFAEARTLAGDDRALVTQIDNAASRLTRLTAVRGLTTGATTHYDRVLAGTTDIYTLTFRGGELAQVAVIGDGDTDLDLRVYDQNGNLVCSDTDWTDRTLCGWIPAWTGPFRVSIQNLGRVYNDYALMTN